MSHSDRNVIEDIIYSWAIYCPTKKDVLWTQKEIDNIFSDFSFYPGIEWDQYGYKPPQDYQVLGAWRLPTNQLFAFLLDNPSMMSFGSSYPLLVYVIGHENEVDNLVPKLDRLKSRFSNQEKRGMSIQAASKSIEKVHKARHIVFLASILGVFTAIINGFSLYIRELPSPHFQITMISKAYSFLLSLIHPLSIILLICVIILIILITIFYGILVLKRMR